MFNQEDVTFARQVDRAYPRRFKPLTGKGLG